MFKNGLVAALVSLTTVLPNDSEASTPSDILDQAPKGQCWYQGDTLLHSNKAKLEFGTSGFLEYSLNNNGRWNPVWRSGRAGTKVCFWHSGKMSLYNADDKLRWAANSGSDKSKSLQTLSNCRLVLTGENERVLYDKGCADEFNGSKPETNWFRQYANGGQCWTQGDTLLETQQGRMELTNHGYLEYWIKNKNIWDRVWRSNKKGAKACLWSVGKLSLYDADDKLRWQANSGEDKHKFLQITPQCELNFGGVGSRSKALYNGGCADNYNGSVASILNNKIYTNHGQCWDRSKTILKTKLARLEFFSGDHLIYYVKNNDEWDEVWRSSKKGERLCLRSHGKFNMYDDKGNVSWVGNEASNNSSFLEIDKNCRLGFNGNNQNNFYNDGCRDKFVSVDIRKDRTELAKELAPVFYFHPHEKYFPVTITNFIKHSRVRDEKDETINRKANNVAEFVEHIEDLEVPYLEENAEWAQNGNTLSDAKVYVKYIDSNAGYLDIHYAVLFPFNGCQTFRIKTRNFDKTRTRRFPWCNMARHYGDWEHATVRVSKSDGEVVGVYTAGHGHARFTYYDDMEWVDGTHPKVYFALNTHATYTKSSMFYTGTIIGGNWSFLSDLALNILSFKTIDVTAYYGSDGDALISDRNAPDRTEHHVWHSKNRLLVLPKDDPIFKFNGRWGQRLNNTGIKQPPLNIPYTDDDILRKLVKDNLPSKFKYGNGPKSPFEKDWWIEGHAPCKKVNVGNKNIHVCENEPKQ
ncbi:Vps62-related protein [Pleionea sp. CnH1-48]|uniref:Vps62-related protein n=1 Tax=Pleionea sp. CnH1-48 TaxID=2954494 RepID=UPI0020980169|nr:Vps62-related protein [Pleionea sp. CnH1-48]MCO7226175.1 Vps62-related protein [Pleionea sp. CnH1-48]